MTETPRRKYTPGERAKHWASAFMTLWPAWVFVLGTLGYTNKDEIGGFFAPAHGETSVAITDDATQWSKDIVARIGEFQAELDLLKAEAALRVDINRLKAEVDEIKELVN